LVRIDQSFYPINGIIGVEIKKPNNANDFIFAVLAFIAAGAAWYDEAGPIVAGIILATGVIYFLIGFLKPSFLVLRTANGDQQALSSKNLVYLLAVKTAIETVMTERS